MLPIVVLVALFVVAMFFFIVYYRGMKKVNTILRNQALKRVGTLKENYFSSGSSVLTFPYQDFNVKIYAVAPYFTGEQTYFLVSFDKILENNMTIKYRTRLSTTSNDSMQSRYIKTGNSEFDVLYKIKGKNPNFATDVLTVDIRKKLLEIKNYKPFIKLEKDNLKLVAQNFVLMDEDFDKLIGVVQKFIDRLIELKAFQDVLH